MAEFNSRNDSLKVIVIGDSGVGKTAITKRLVENSFQEHTASTIGIEYEFTTINVNGKSVKLSIWDTAGQEKFKSVSRAYYRQAACVLLVFDITVKETFEHVNSWLQDVRSLSDGEPSFILVGNKSDLAESRVVSTSEAQDFGEENHIEYIETSAKEGTNVSEAFIRCAAVALTNNDATTVQAAPTLKNNQTNSKSGGCC